ncbi:hypothetical protein ACFL6M_00765 [Candidatus Eisenbacteria bacterium]|uniref:Fibronectin type-III domain-containing protein n=1 Tax=Eiseniibacteriota bacterium TaxID=2212470 RepID=A0ABV6YIE2_UNCEI
MSLSFPSQGFVDRNSGKSAPIRTRLALLTVFVAASFAAWSLPARSIQGTITAKEAEIHLPGPMDLSDDEGRHPLSSMNAQRQLAEAMPGWSLSWNQAEDGMFRATGKLQLVEQPDRFIIGFVAEYASVLGIGPRDLDHVDTRQAGPVENRFYRQSHEGIPVEGSRISFTFANDGSLVHFTSRTAANLELDTVEAEITLAEARRLALADLPVAGDVTWQNAELVILPNRFSGLDNDRLAWRMFCNTSAPAGAWQLLVDAGSGELLERRSLEISAVDTSIPGSVKGSISFPTPWDPELEFDFPYISVSVYQQDSLLATGVTDAHGQFELVDVDLAAGEDFTVETNMRGLYATILEYDWTVAPEPTSLLNPQFPATITLDSTTTSEAVRAAYLHINTAHDRIKAIDPAFWPLDMPLPVIVSDTTEACNAYAYINPAAPYMRFLAASDFCPNTAQIADVVYHEYGHLISMYSYYPDTPPGSFHEAFSDYFAASIADTSIIGNGFTGPDTWLRNLDNDRTYPVDEVCETIPHCVGEVLGAALWEMRTALIDQLGDREAGVDLSDRLFHYMRYLRPHEFQDVLVSLLLVDDDDGNFSNGTPHLESIVPGFEKHQLADLSVQITHVPAYDTEDTLSAVSITATVAAIYPMDPTGVQIHWQADGGEFSVGTMDVDGWTATYQLPKQPAGTVVGYYITATDQAGHESLLPEAAPAELFTYFVGDDTTSPLIVHAPPGDPTDTQERVWLNAHVTDNTGLIGLVEAAVAVSQGDSSWTDQVTLTAKDAVLAPGIFEGYLDATGIGADATLAYHVTAQDASAASNESRFPEWGDVPLTIRQGRTWDLEADTPDLLLNGEWQRGEPGFGPAPARSGSIVAGTAIGTYYSSDLISDLTTAEIDLSGWSTAVLQFSTWYQIENEWDGGRVFASRDNGQTWELLTPLNGYPGWIFDTWGEEHYLELPPLYAFTGSSPGWVDVQVPLTSFLDGPLSLKLEFRTDGGVTDIGWYVDDIRIIESFISPERLWATDGQDEAVTLGWAPSPGIDPEDPELLGYNVYRSDRRFGYPLLPVNGAPIEDTRYTDASLVNGTLYYYTVTSVFTSSESPRSNQAVGYPYRAELDMSSQIEMTVAGSSRGQDSVAVANTGTGDLKLSFYLADEEDEWRDIMPQIFLDGINSEEFRLLADDPVDASAPDLAQFQYREWNGNLIMELALHDTLPNPQTDVTLIIGLDTDMSRATGMDFGSLGADYLVIMGAMSYYFYNGAPAVIADGSTWPPAPIGGPSSLVLQEGLASVEVAVNLGLLGYPPGAGVSVTTAHSLEPIGSSAAPRPNGEKAERDKGKSSAADSSAKKLRRIFDNFGAGLQTDPPVADVMPDMIFTTWLGLTQTYATLTKGEPFDLVFDFDFAGMIEDDYTARLFVRSNDPGRPLEDLPLLVRLKDVPGEGMSAWTATSLESGLLLEWAPADPDSFAGFLLHRWQGELADEDASAVQRGDYFTSSDGAYSFLDKSVVSGVRYFYRLSGVTADGDTTDVSPPAHPYYEPGLPTRLLMEAPRPNPFRSSATFRIHSPGDTRWGLYLVDVTGRMVRNLVAKGVGLPGVHMVAWDGKRDNGSRADQGVYYAVLHGRGKQVIRSLVLIR